MIRVIDIHTHILPGFDDGCRTAEESLKLLQQAQAQGIEGVLATPHYFIHSRQPNLLELETQAAEQLNRACGRDMILGVGQETYWHEDLPDRLLAGEGLTLAQSACVLVEFDPGTSPQKLHRAVQNLTNSGFRPILSHIERYTALRQEKAIEELKSLGAAMQLNLESLQGGWLDQEARRCRKLVTKGYISFLATDMHRPDHRPPEIRQALAWLEQELGAEEAERMTYRNPLHVINKEPLE